MTGTPIVIKSAVGSTTPAYRTPAQLRVMARHRRSSSVRNLTQVYFFRRSGLPVRADQRPLSPLSLGYPVSRATYAAIAAVTITAPAATQAAIMAVQFALSLLLL